MGSPVSLDFGFPFNVNNQSDFDGGIDPRNSNQNLSDTPSTQGNTALTPGQINNMQNRASIDSVFDQDILGQWSPTQDDHHGRTGSLSAHFDAMESMHGKSHNDDAKPPAWSEMKTKAGKERKRLPLACIDCRRKKIRCSGEKPACKHCVKARVPCVYKNTARKAAPRTDYMAMLDKRLKRMEDRVIKMIPKEDLPDLSVTGKSSVRPPIPGQPVKKEKASVVKQSAEEVFDAEINEWTQPKKSDGDLPAPYSKTQKEFETKLSAEGADALPPIPIQEHLAELFFDCVYGQAYLLLHKPSFMRRLKAGNVPPVLMLAVCAISARFSTHPQINTEPAFLRGEQWATAARKIVEKRHFEPNVTILTVMLILGLHFFGTCEGGLSWSFGGQSMRMGYALQLHRELDHDPLGRAQAEREVSKNGTAMPDLPELSFTDREIRRRLMWACYLMDVFNSSGTERPPFLNEEYIKIQLPIKEACFQQEIPGLTEDIEGYVSVPKSSQLQPEQAQVEAKANLGVASYIIRAVVVWKRIIQYLNLGGKEKDPHPIWDPLSQFASLQRQIQQLRKSLPDHLKYNPDNLAVHVSERLANQFLFLHIILAQTSLFLHRFAIPTAPNVHRVYPPNTPKQFLDRSATTVVEAASMISKILADSTGHTLTVPFAGYCAYTSATVHVWGIFSKHPSLEGTSLKNLRHNYRYLTRMKRYWGMFHYMAESVKDIYRLFAEAASSSKSKSTSNKDPSASIENMISANASRSNSPSTAEGGSSTKETETTSAATSPESTAKPILQYGDWFDRYPHGVSEAEWESSHHPHKKDSLRGNEAVMSQKSELRSVEEFFASLSPPSKAVAEDRHRDAVAAAMGQGRGKKIARRRGRSVHENIGSGALAKTLTGTSAQDTSIQATNTNIATTARSQRVGSASNPGISTMQNQTPNQTPNQNPNQTPSQNQGFNQNQGQAANRSTPYMNTTGMAPLNALDMGSSDIDIPMSDFSTGPRLQSQPGNAFDMSTTNSPSYFTGGFSGLTPHRSSLEYEYNSPSTGSNQGSTSNQNPNQGQTQAQGQNHSQMNFNFNYTSALPQLDRQMVFGAYAGLDPSTSNNSSALNNPNNLDFWGTSWDGMPSGGDMPGPGSGPGRSIDMDSFGNFDDMAMGGMGALNNDTANLGVRGRMGSAPNSSRTGPGPMGAPSNFNSTSARQNSAGAAMGSSAWFMPFNIEPPVFPGLEEFGMMDSMDPSNTISPGDRSKNNHNSGL